MGIFRGQGATEYLVLLAVVLIVALVSVALLGFFPGMASDARITQSQSYWRGQAQPFAIQDASLSGPTGQFSVQNMNANPMTLVNLSVGGVAFSGTGNGSFGAGEIKTVTTTVPNCASGSIYDLNVTIAYKTSAGISNTEYGTKNLVGKCS